MTLRKFIFFLLFLICAQFAFSQPVYKLSWKKEAAFLGTGGIMLGLGNYLNQRTPLFTTDELMTLDVADINAFDRLATDYSSDQAHQVSNYLWYGAQLLPVAFLAGNKTRSDAATIGVLYLETVLLNSGITLMFKSTFRRPRPFVFDPDADLTRKQSISAKASFVSGHTSMTAAGTFFTAKVFSDYYPDSKWKPVVWTAAAVIPALTGYMRVRAGRHYPTDTMAGYAIGAAVGILVPHLHKNKDGKDSNVQIGIGLNSATLSLRL